MVGGKVFSISGTVHTVAVLMTNSRFLTSTKKIILDMTGHGTALIVPSNIEFEYFSSKAQGLHTV